MQRSGKHSNAEDILQRALEGCRIKEAIDNRWTTKRLEAAGASWCKEREGRPPPGRITSYIARRNADLGDPGTAEALARRSPSPPMRSHTHVLTYADEA